MNVPSPVLSVLKHHGAVGGEADGVIQVPSIFLPTIQIPLALETMGAPDTSSGARANSFFHSSNVLVANGGANQQIFARLRPGLWQLYIQACYAGSFTAATAFRAAAIQMRLNDGSGFLLNLLTLVSAQVSFAITESVERIISLEREAELVWNLEANGVGEEARLNFAVIANRLL